MSNTERGDRPGKVFIDIRQILNAYILFAVNGVCKLLCNFREHAERNG